MNPEEFGGRITLPYEKVLTTLVDNIQHIESTTYNGLNVVKVYLQPGASLETANAQVTAASQFILRQLPAGEQPLEIINFSASSVPILQLGISGKGLNEQQLNDYSLNFIRPQLITVPGSVLPSPYGGKQRQIMVNLDQRLMQSKGLAPSDILAALTAQSMVLPSGTAKIGQSEYDILNNVAPRTIEELNNIRIKQVDGAMIYMCDVATVSDGFLVLIDAAERLYRSAADGFELKSCLGHLRTFYEELHMQVATAMAETAGTTPPTKFGVALSFLRQQTFFTEKEEKFSGGLYGLISDEAVHSMMAGREYARLMRNMVIEFGLVFLTIMEKRDIKVGASNSTTAVETQPGSVSSSIRP